MDFKRFELNALVLKAVEKAGYKKPTTIQQESIGPIIEGFDLKAQAQTGTGKTAAFLLPILHNLAKNQAKKGSGPRALILVPTRELAQQVTKQSEKYSQFLPKMKSVCVVGGIPYNKQLNKMSKPYEILIATPGRLIDFIEQKKVDFSRVEVVVLDEADRMLDMGFIKPIENIIAKLPKKTQKLFFSATLKGAVGKLALKLLTDPLEINVSEDLKNENITQKLYFADHIKHKNQLLEHILENENVFNAIVFTSTKRQCDKLVKELKVKDYQVAALHGDIRQNKRSRIIDQFKKNKIQILIATDVAARGIDIEVISHIINFDLPPQPEDYVHRIGRTGRAGKTGIALSICNQRQGSYASQKH